MHIPFLPFIIHVHCSLSSSEITCTSQPVVNTVVANHIKEMEEVELEITGTSSAKSDELQLKPVTFGRLLSYADTVDWVLMGLGTVGSVVHGMAQPIGYLLLGKALEAFGTNIGNQEAMVRALEKVILVIINHL